jgi:hypothetical protein
MIIEASNRVMVSLNLEGTINQLSFLRQQYLFIEVVDFFHLRSVSG